MTHRLGADSEQRSHLTRAQAECLAYEPKPRARSAWLGAELARDVAFSTTELIRFDEHIVIAPDPTHAGIEPLITKRPRFRDFGLNTRVFHSNKFDHN